MSDYANFVARKLALSPPTGLIDLPDLSPEHFKAHQQALTKWALRRGRAAIFADTGLGGFTEGATQAGCRVVWAGNHWRAAVDWHAANHPETEHACQDLHQADWSRVPAHDLLLASPACQGHTRARGKERPHHDATRSTAWAVVSALECHRPALGVVENVPEFARWQLFPAWCSALHALGYAVSPHLVDAADSGVPQHRRRLFIALTRSKHPVELKLPRREHAPAAGVIDFAAGSWSPVARPGRSIATLERIRAGRQRHGARFLTAYYGNERGGRPLDRPVGTITTRDRWAVIDGDRMRMLTENPCPGVERHKEKPAREGADHLSLMLAWRAAAPWMRALMVMAYVIGQRRGDVRKLRETDFTGRGLLLGQNKTGTELLMQWTPNLRAAHAYALSVPALKGGVSRAKTDEERELAAGEAAAELPGALHGHDQNVQPTRILAAIPRSSPARSWYRSAPMRSRPMSRSTHTPGD